VTSSPIARQRGTTDKRRTTTTNSSSSHHHDGAPSRPHSLICTGAEPIHPVHASSQLGRAAVAPRNEVIFLPFWRGLLWTQNSPVSCYTCPTHLASAVCCRCITIQPARFTACWSHTKAGMRPHARIKARYVSKSIGLMYLAKFIRVDHTK